MIQKFSISLIALLALAACSGSSTSSRHSVGVTSGGYRNPNLAITSMHTEVNNKLEVVNYVKAALQDEKWYDESSVGSTSPRPGIGNKEDLNKLYEIAQKQLKQLQSFINDGIPDNQINEDLKIALRRAYKLAGGQPDAIDWDISWDSNIDAAKDIINQVSQYFQDNKSAIESRLPDYNAPAIKIDSVSFKTYAPKSGDEKTFKYVLNDKNVITGIKISDSVKEIKLSNNKFVVKSSDTTEYITIDSYGKQQNLSFMDFGVYKSETYDDASNTLNQSSQSVYFGGYDSREIAANRITENKDFKGTAAVSVQNTDTKTGFFATADASLRFNAENKTADINITGIENWYDVAATATASGAINSVTLSGDATGDFAISTPGDIPTTGSFVKYYGQGSSPTEAGGVINFTQDNVSFNSAFGGRAAPAN